MRIYLYIVCLSFLLISFFFFLFLTFFFAFSFLKNSLTIFAFIIFQSIVSPRNFTHLNIITWANHVIVKKKKRRWLNSYEIFLCKYIFSFLLLFYYSSNTFHHPQVLMKVYENRNILTLTFHYNKFITLG